MFAALYADPDQLRGFLSAMSGISAGPAHAIAGKFPWRDYKTFMDLGSAQGMVPATLARAHPHLTGIGFALGMERLVMLLPPSAAERRCDVFVMPLSPDALDGALRLQVGNNIELSLEGSNLLNTTIVNRQQLAGDSTLSPGAAPVWRDSAWIRSDRRFQLGVRLKY